MENWYVVQFKSNSHKVAKQNLEKQGFKTFLPVEEITKRRSNCFVNELQPLFPGYMFVSFNPKVSSWHKINNTKGVSRIICNSQQPKPVPQEIITGLKYRFENSEKFSLPNRINEGELVKFRKGPFANFVGTVERIDVQQRMWILLKSMNQQIRMAAINVDI